MVRAMHELERLQANRAGEHVPAPVVVDVDVSLTKSSRPSSGYHRIYRLNTVVFRQSELSSLAMRTKVR